MQGFRPRRLDLAAPALLALAGAVEHAVAGYERWPLGLAAYALAAGALVFARALPLVLPPAVAAVYAATPLAGFDVSQPASWIPVLAFAALAAGLYAPPSRRPAGLASVLAALALAYAGLAWLTDFDPSLVFGLAMTVGPWALGVALRTALERERRVGAEAARTRLEIGLARERAVTAERERIASELQDVLAHTLGAMVVQSSAAAELVSRDAQEARRILDGVAGAGRDALAETGRLLRVLRDESKPETAPTAVEAPEPRIRLGDAVLPAAFGLVATGEALANGYEQLPALLGVCWLACALLVARRAAPLAMPLGVTAILLADRLLGAEADELASSILIGGLAYFAAGRHVARPALGLAAALGGLALLVADTAAAGDLSADIVLLVLVVLAPWAVGAALRRTLARTRGHAAVAERTRLEGEAAAARAVSAERRRIARELHDLLARSLSVMTVQASLAAELAGEDDDRADAAVGEVERAGRAALDDTGRLLRLVHGESDNGRHPQPGLADLPALAAEYARAGLAVELENGSLGSVPAGIEVSVYRIVQEALTNALKHAPGSRVRVRLARDPSGVAVEVVNGRPGDAHRAAVRSGHGLIGVRERVAVYGGSLDARPTADGGFVLAATLPVSGAE